MQKTQRDKDWLMLARLCGMYPKLARRLAVKRPVLKCAIAGHVGKTQKLIIVEERCARKNDRLYWDPLKKELEAMRLNRVRL